MYLVTAEEMRQMDKQTIEQFGIPGRILMENAGKGATNFFLENFSDVYDKKIAILSGRGNNGGDGFVIARYLSQKNINITVYLLADQNKVTGDAKANLDLLYKIAVPVIEIQNESDFNKSKNELQGYDIFIDAIFGTGLNSNVKGFYKNIIELVNNLNKPVFSVDIPSGLNADTGQVCGVCIKSCATSTFALAKTGHFIYPGPNYIGKLGIVDIGIPNYIEDQFGGNQYLLTPNMIKEYIKPKSPDAHKGTNGHLLIVACSPGKTGAGIMAAMAAMRSGAGLITLGVPENLNPIVESQVIEAMTLPLPETKEGTLSYESIEDIIELSNDKKCLAIGPGISTSVSTIKLILGLVEDEELKLPLIIDADGLNCLVGHVDKLKNIKYPVILTPHPGEMARLMDTTISSVQNNRIEYSRKFATEFNVYVVLKGAGTVIAHPDGKIFINQTGNPGMASGGMGDVLTGIIASFMAQGYTPEAAINIGVYIHGAAADHLLEKIGYFGFIASDLINVIPDQMAKLKPDLNLTQNSYLYVRKCL